MGILIAFALILLPLFNAPFHLCLGFVILSHFRIPEVFPVLLPLRLPELMAVGSLAALGWHLLGTHRIRPFWSTELTLFALFFADVTLGILFASNRPTAFQFWSSYYVKIGAMTLAIAWLSTGPRQFAMIARAFVVAGLAVGGVALWNQLHGIDLVEGGRVTIGRELGSVLGDPNDLALVLLFPVSFALGLAFTSGIPGFSRVLGLSASTVLALAIMATQSRGGLLGFAGVLIPFAQRKIKSKFVLIALAACVAVALFAVAGIGQRTIVTDAGDGLDESAMGRVLAWEAAIGMAIAHPFTGVGIHTFVDNYFFYTDQWAGKSVAAHSVWFEVLAETGFIGLILYVAMIGATAGKLLRACRWLHQTDADPFARAMALALVGGLAGFVVSGTFLSQAYSWPIYILMALSVGVSRYARNGLSGFEPARARTCATAALSARKSQPTPQRP